ncbi:MAG: RagB/SusD family nutrient uptake outer membrane protein [Tannerella sp.]|jgi:hypothetical protein|nr:RagB/SusD family nutrient uptake outer membrane protein [Tannerella sp.]
MKKYLILSCLAGLVFTSCSDQLEITPPNNIIQEQIDELLASDDEAIKQKVFAGLASGLPATFRSAVPGGESVGRYNDIQGLESMRNLAANDVVFGAARPNSWGADEYEVADLYQSNSPKNYPYWRVGWININAANKLLMYLTPEVVGNSAILKQYKAMGLTVRAYYYNWLMETYQDAYMNGGSGKLGLMWYDEWKPTQPNKARESATQTYAHIKEDIAEAVQLFSQTIGYTPETSDIDLGVAAFVQARVALCAGDWNTVVSASNIILDKTNTLMDESQYVQTPDEEDEWYYAENNAFLNNAINPEVLLGWDRTISLKTNGAWRNVFISSYGGSNLCWWRIDNRLYEQIDANDYRKDNFLANDFGDYEYPANGGTYTIPAYSNLKFAAMARDKAGQDKNTCNQVDDAYMRLSEVYLMKAEAQEAAGDANGAKATLNTLLAARSKTGQTLTCDNYQGAANLSLKQFIQLQWRIEMWGERGIEFYNNKRWNIPVDRTSSANHTAKPTYPVSLMTLAIPRNEMDYNPLCEQN